MTKNRISRSSEHPSSWKAGISLSLYFHLNITDCFSFLVLQVEVSSGQLSQTETQSTSLVKFNGSDFKQKQLIHGFI
jgi:hypothetical protein